MERGGEEQAMQVALSGSSLCIGVVITKVSPSYLLSCLASSSDCCSWVNCRFGCRPLGWEGNGSLPPRTRVDCIAEQEPAGETSPSDSGDSLFILLKRVLSSLSRVNVANYGIYSVVSSVVGFSNVV